MTGIKSSHATEPKYSIPASKFVRVDWDLFTRKDGDWVNPGLSSQIFKANIFGNVTANSRLK